MVSAAITHLERDYAGFIDKLAAPGARATYEARRDRVVSRADTARLYRCRSLINELLATFDDGHLYTSPRVEMLEEDTMAVMALLGGAPRYRPRIVGLPLERQLKTLIEARRPGQGPADTLLGIWETGGYRVAIVPQLPAQPGARLDEGVAPYVMVILSSQTTLWSEGMIKAWFWSGDTSSYPLQWVALFADRGHRLRHMTAPAPGKAHPTLDLISGWRRVWPDTIPGWPQGGTAASIPAGTSTPPDPNAPTYHALGDTAGYLRLPSFDAGYTEEVKRIVRQHGQAWGGLRALVIDLRGNGGGSDLVHAPLRPYLFDGPFYQWGVEEWSSTGNLAKWSLYEQVLAGRVHRADRRAIRRSRRRMATAPMGTWVTLTPPREQVPIRARPGPTRIILLIDTLVASAAEQLLIDLEQSPRAIRMGTHSAGILDYANLMVATLPCGMVQLAWPTTRSRRVREGLGIDGRGLPPQVDLSGVPPADWVDTALRELAKHPRGPNLR